MPVPALREELRRIPNGRNVFNVASVWLQTFGLLALACWLTVRLPLALALPIWAVTFLLMGRGFALVRHPRPRSCAPAAVLEEAVERRRRPMAAWPIPAFVPFDAYRRVHFAHHKDEMGPNEPDLGLYRGYPITADSMRRKLTRDAARQLRLEEPQGPARRLHEPDGPPGRHQDRRRAGRALRRALASRPAAGGSIPCSGSRRG